MRLIATTLALSLLMAPLTCKGQSREVKPDPKPTTSERKKVPLVKIRLKNGETIVGHLRRWRCEGRGDCYAELIQGKSIRSIHQDDVDDVRRHKPAFLRKVRTVALDAIFIATSPIWVPCLLFSSR